MTTVRVIGAGMSGLLTAFYLAEKNIHVEVYEKSNTVGGKIATHLSPHGLMETAANAILADREVERVASAIGLQLIAARPEARRRWVFRDGDWRRWPLGAGASLRVARFLWSRRARRPRAGETLAVWGERELGAEATANLLEPVVQGIFGAGPRDLSATLIYDYFFSAPKRVRGHLRGSVAPVGGMGEFPERLKSYLEKRGVVFHMDAVASVEGSLVIATDLRSAAEILQRAGDQRGAELARLPLVDLVSVNAFVRSPGARQGFGLLFPRASGVAPLGVLFNTFIFSGRSEKSLSETWIFGGVSPQTVIQASDDAVVDEVQKAREMISTAAEVLETRVNRWPGAIPLYGVELEKCLASLKTSENGIHLMGNYLGEIGLHRLVHRARALADRIVPK